MNNLLLAAIIISVVYIIVKSYIKPRRYTVISKVSGQVFKRTNDFEEAHRVATYYTLLNPEDNITIEDNNFTGGLA